MEKKEYFKNIEFLRIIGCIAVVIYHLCDHTSLHKFFPDIDLYTNLFNITKNGNKAVDLFFILSGFFFAYKFNITQTFWDFLKVKLVRLWPVLIFVIALYFLVSLTGILKFTFYENIFCFLGLTGTSLSLQTGQIGAFWYVSSMLWVFSFYFYLIKNY